MKNENLHSLSEEIRKIKYRVDYKINETPKYRSLIGIGEEFDEVPVITNEAGEQEDTPKPEGNVPPAPSNDKPLATPASTPEPAFDNDAETSPPEDMEVPKEPMSDMNTGDSMGVPENQVNDIQNEIIKHNIEAMKSIHNQLEGLNAMVQGLNSKLESLNADVEEVREPSNMEKLVSKKEVSYPYYFNLNDFWQGNWFDEKRNRANEKGVKELPDGTFVADFDELPRKSKTDIQSSFNDMV